MRKVFLIAGNSLLLAIRDPKTLVFAIVLPLIATWITGTMLKGLLNESAISPATVLVVNSDSPTAATPAYGAQLVRALMESGEARRVLVPSLEGDLDAARERVAAGKATAVVYFPPTFTADALAGRNAQVRIYTDPSDQTRGAMVTEVIRSFSDGLVTQLQGFTLAGSGAGGLGTAPPIGPATRITLTAAGVRPVSAMQYYAAACSLLFMMVTALMRSGRVLEERATGTLQRMLATPTSRAEVLAGQVGGSALLNLAQWLLLLPVTHLLLGVSWGPWPGAILLGAAFALASAGTGTAAATVLRDQKAADMASGVVGNLFGVLSGALVPLYAFPNVLKVVARLTPNYWAMQGLLDQMSGTGQGRLVLPVTVLVTMAVVTGAFGTWRLAAR